MLTDSCKPLRQLRPILMPLLGIALSAIVTSAPACAKDKIILQLDWLASGEKSAPYIGRTLDYFDSEGIEVDIRRGTGAADARARWALRRAALWRGSPSRSFCSRRTSSFDMRSDLR